MIPVNHNGFFFSPCGPTEQEPNDLGDQMRHITLKPLVSDHTNTHTSANTQARLGAHVGENKTESSYHSGYLETMFCTWVIDCSSSSYVTLLCLNIWQLVPPYVAEMISISAEQRSASASEKEDRIFIYFLFFNFFFLGVQWLDKCPNSRHPPSVCSSAPQNVTPFIIPPHATQLRLAAFFSYNQAFILILWWLSQTLEQTVAPQLALSGRRFDEADTLSCEHLPIHACKKKLYLQGDFVKSGVIYEFKITVNSF